MLSSDGFGAGATPWRAGQVAAWEALNQHPRRTPDPSTDPEARALRVYQRGRATPASWPTLPADWTAQGLLLIEETLLEVEQRVERLR